MRFGIIGTGFISDWFVDACRLAGGTPVGIYSRDLERGQAFADRHGLSLVVGSVEELAASDEIDAVYVASPIAAHHRQTAAVLDHGKPVLCEKTLATSPDEVADLFERADRAGCVLLEAVRPNHDPVYDLIRSALPRLGTLRHAHLEKCQYSSRYPAFLRGEVLNALDPASGNSALRDIGVYCIHPSLLLFGTPLGTHRASYRLPNGFEAGGSLLLDYGDLSVTCTYSKVTNSVTPSVILGEQGSLRIDSVAEPGAVEYVGLDGEVETLLTGSPRHPRETLHHPIEAFLELCRQSRTDHPYRQLSLAAEQIMSTN